MGKRPRRKNLKPPGRCIFCCRGSMSREHFWSEWTHLFWPRGTDDNYVEEFLTFNQKTNLANAPTRITRPGRTVTKKLRVVCKKCNETWMSKIETDTKPVLSLIIKGEPITLGRAQRYQLAKWIALKVMVSEQNVPKDAVITQAERSAFMEAGAMPVGLKIVIAQIDNEKWRNSYSRHAATLSASPHPPIGAEGKNVQTTTFGIGTLLVFCSVITFSGLDFRFEAKTVDALACLWPLRDDDINWPMSHIL